MPADYTFKSLKFAGSEEIIGCGSYRNLSVENGFIFAGQSGGTNWKITQTKEILTDIAMTSGNTGFCLSDYKMFMTNDNWNSMRQVFDSAPNAYIDAVTFEDSAHGLLRTSNYHFYDTSDKGDSWHQSGLEMPMSMRVKKMQYNNQGDLLVLGDRGFILKLSEKNSQNKTEEQETSQKLKYELFQNYPNPFNPVTQISFSLHEKGSVELKVFDVLGREIKTLLNEVKDAGTYSVPFNASELPSGIYISRLKAGSEVMVRKMLLLR
ncbi:MAG: T9SS type A sorting domain-containing protein [Ignavibacteria bacterium]|nr:T9SS type A sorting domain-containing protein [Ignavibacteria bacterium]MCU7522618.1 T9SS type A sorting domain-containing protein [Ignavibacteria bacterium]